MAPKNYKSFNKKQERFLLKGRDWKPKSGIEKACKIFVKFVSNHLGPDTEGASDRTAPWETEKLQLRDRRDRRLRGTCLGRTVTPGSFPRSSEFASTTFSSLVSQVQIHPGSTTILTLL